MKKIFIIIMTLILFVGCDPQGDIEFTVINTTQNSKMIVLSHHLKIDTFNIKPNDTTQIYYGIAIGGIMDNKDNININEIFDTIYSNDSLLTKNIQNINNWTFSPEIINENKHFVSGGINRFEFIITIKDIDNKEVTKSKADTFIQVQEINKLNVLVLPPYDKIVNRGISPNVRKYLEKGLKKNNDIQLIEFPFKKLMNVPYHQIFDKKYCKPITDNIDCDIIIMSKLDFVKETGHMPRDGWNLRIKIYNVNTDKQIISRLKVDSLSNAGIKKILLETDKVIINEIKETVANTI